ncbi:MAG: SOS response-associated peptidase [Verrucomicrobiota bacterium]
MCGRYTITSDLAELEKLVRFICKVVDFKPRYNLAPRAKAPVLVWENGQPVLKPMRWGLIPSWSKDETIGDKLTNARADTITEKPSYRRPFEKQRCLIPADGFYEWQTTATGKQPFRFTRKDGGFFCMAGLWEKWHRPPRMDEFDLGDDAAAGQVVETFTIITTEPNPMVAAVHDRMPVILSPEHFQWWLQPDRFEPQFLKTLLRPYPAEDMACYRVSKLVNNARLDSPDCLQTG